MILTRSPLRISLGGGGTDLPSYFEKFGGFLIAGAIDKYVYVNVSKPFDKSITLKYSRVEKVNEISSIEHPIIRETLRELCPDELQIEISTIADIPAGTGLGSSSSFATALVKALYSYNRHSIHAAEIAQLACEIEIGKLNEPIGKQDQYASAFGGINSYEFKSDGNVLVTPLKILNKTLTELDDNLLLFYTGQSRNARSILNEQKTKSLSLDEDMINNLHFVKDTGYKSREALEAGDLNYFGELMHEHWMRKKERSGKMSNSEIDHWYEIARQNGATGGKLVGAGGGGFLMFHSCDNEKLRQSMAKIGLQELRFSFDFDGTKVVFS